MTEANGESVRADQWLWAARFFKTRGLSRAAVNGGKVEHNGSPCKPSRAVKIGDRLRVTRGQEHFDIAVLAVFARRQPASVAQTMYAETETSRQTRDQQRQWRQLSGLRGPQRRPDKQERRQLCRIKQQR